MKKGKKAVGYVCDIPITGTDMVISRDDQKMRIIKHAKKEGYDVVEIVEDTEYTENVMDRPGVKKILNRGDYFDCVLVERVWSLSRKRKDLDPFMAELDKRDCELAASSYLWDCVSQMVRHRYAGSLAEKCRMEMEAKTDTKSRATAA